MSSAAPDVSSEELSVTFQPPLALQRRSWVFSIMRRENVTSVLDIGCGEGALISCLCNPAPWLPPPPPHILPSPDTHDHAIPTPRDIDGVASTEGILRPKVIRALDISPKDLQDAIEETTPKVADPASGSAIQPSPRWEDLEVKIWQGSLEDYNPEFVDTECIVSTEVIEHLPEDILPKFAPMLLGAYHPRLLLITTPSYTFNARFTAPDSYKENRDGYSDPTGRTDRIFRHHDHKFEWTVEEFTEWCEAVAEKWGYEVEVGGVGTAVEKDPWGRDAQLGFASQVAAFKRKEGGRYQELRETECARMGILTDTPTLHTLVATQKHTSHPQTGKPARPEAINDTVKNLIKHWNDNPVSLRDIWFENEVNILCGGWVEVLVGAIRGNNELKLRRSSTDAMWEVYLNGFVPTANEDSGGVVFDLNDEEEVHWEEEEETSWEESFDDRIIAGDKYQADIAWGGVSGSDTSGWTDVCDALEKHQGVVTDDGWGWLPRKE
ncbi:hypothetical protein K474DRAFT_1640864 [Panus rudis PR-1116 ss-1]|nr:hypothetical protein K474DRAFT_1640864 [Panus rudis PR-1116 ss-1]